jgi:hypothetical protein
MAMYLAVDAVFCWLWKSLGKSLLETVTATTTTGRILAPIGHFFSCRSFATCIFIRYDSGFSGGQHDPIKRVAAVAFWNDVTNQSG